MDNGKFLEVSASDKLNNWDLLISRESKLYSRENDIRTEFGRDYTRILHSLAYRRLKHKTQVFFNTQNDHICTRIEHVNHVESVSFTIAKYLGLNTELTKAIATSHDLGHAPFGHHGESCLKELAQKYLNQDFWHEKHGLYCVDNIELLENDKRQFENLGLTYAVRDGIISHCGELDDNFIVPRKEYMDLSCYNCIGQYQPYTWEACVVKIADKIAYLGRDIEDAIRLGFISIKELRELSRIAKKYNYENLNTTLIMHELIIDLCNSSSPEHGIELSESNFEMMKDVKNFNNTYIYKSSKFDKYKEYVKLIIHTNVEFLVSYYSTTLETITKILTDTDNALANTNSKISNINLLNEFIAWLINYIDFNHLSSIENIAYKLNNKHKNRKLYNVFDKSDYVQAVLHFVAGMTDQYAIKAFQSLTSF